jgi:hypothetical protein
MKKTYKREVAAAAMIYAAALGVFAAATGSESALKVYEMTIAPVMILAAGAFGFDAWVKQGASK